MRRLCVSTLSAIVVVLMIGAMDAPASAQTSAQQSQESQRTSARRQNQLLNQRYQIGVMERVLEDAVEHGASIWRDRLQSVLPSQTMLLDNARARGFRLEGYGVFFDVEVPSLELETTLFSVFRTLDQNGLGLQSALNQVKAHIVAAGDPNLEQALKRIELQLAPIAQSTTAPSIAGARTAGGSAAVTVAEPAGPDPRDPILNDPVEAYRAEVKDALIDAMLDHSSSLAVDAAEWLTIAAKRNEVRPRVALGDSDARTIIIRVRGSDLAAFRAGQLSREQAIERVEVRVF
ncbi:MAG: hypothetical protein C5B57_04710 [Blastocatellia bacterium]|nr:MAG: hypothetical protein C5B57_04710 [Blastocatellia bacterium]